MKPLILLILLLTSVVVSTEVHFTQYQIIDSRTGKILQVTDEKENFPKSVDDPSIYLNTENLLLRVTTQDTVYYYFPHQILVKQYHIIMKNKE